MVRIEALLSARLFLSPQLVGRRIYFISNLSGRLSLYVMDYGGSIPEPLLPPDLALQNPDLMGGYAFHVFPKLGKILVMLDQDGDEKYQPMIIPLEGGFPEPAFGSSLANSRVHLSLVFPDQNIVYLNVESCEAPVNIAYRADLATGKLDKLAESQYGAFPAAASQTHERVIIADGYTAGDEVLFLKVKGQDELHVISGIPLEQREPGQIVPLTGINAIEFSPGQDRLLALSSIFHDTYGPAFLDLDHPDNGFTQVRLEGVVHSGEGEITGLKHLADDRYGVTFNIDGCSWLYEASFNQSRLTLRLEGIVAGLHAPLANGVMESFDYDADEDRFVLSFSTATSPTQIYTVEGRDRNTVMAHTRERIMGVSPELLARGEDASFVSFDGTRVSARLYLPADSLGFKNPRPLVYYIHGGPQSQERPDFAWFSMPLIQYLTLNGFAVFVPNVRGSTGYGLNYMKQVDRDWGGKDRLDHVYAMEMLAQDARVDTSRAGVVGRSYGGYMTLTLASRHPFLWSGAVDMFGPFDLLSFMDRIPETWKPYFHMAVGNPATERDLLIERSPKTYIDQVVCPMLVIQGKNDPRVVEIESHDLVDHLRNQGKEVDYLMFENEGHDVLKFENRVRCYTEITEFFIRCLKP